jgi:hypothetical protein
MLDKPTAHRNIVLALRLTLVSLLIFAGTLLIGVIVRYG